MDVLLYNIDLHDRLAEHAGRRGKKRAVLGEFLPLDRREWAANWEKARAKNARGWRELQARSRSPEAQREFDDEVWHRTLPPLNVNTIGWAYWLRKVANWEKRWRLCPAPAEWAQTYLEDGAPVLLDARAGRLYLDSHDNYHAAPPPYEIRGVDVHETAKDGKRLGALSDFELELDARGRPANLLKGGKQAHKVAECRFRGGTLFKDGQPYNEPGRFKDGQRLYGGKLLTIDPSGPYSRCYDTWGRIGLAREQHVKPGLYYDANAVGRALRSRGANPTLSDHGRDFPSLRNWVAYGHQQTIRDEAMKFMRLVYDLPARQPTHTLATIVGSQGLDRGLIKGPLYGHAASGATSLDILRFYDAIHPFLSADEEFARAVGRYLPWIKTPDDVIAIVDNYLVQGYANNLMKYRLFTDHEQAQFVMMAVLVQDDASITDPWMEFLFTRGWEYPQALSGLGDNLATGTDRDGGTTIGSFMYAMGGATKTMELMERYIGLGGNKKYDLSDPRQYPAIRLKPYFLLEGNAAGRVNPGIGDVGGIAEYYGRLASHGAYRPILAAGWRWHRDPKFAWDLVNTYKRGTESDAEWAEIAGAAKKCPRDPFLMNQSRVLSNWGGYLRSGPGHDDWRFQRAAVVRVGTGTGHAHSDTLDLRLFAFGLTMASDFNQRPAYGWPPHHRTRLHNLVEVDGKTWQGHAWVRNLFDAPGSPYLRAESVAPHGMEHVKLFARQVALVDVREGKAGGGVKDASVAMPSSYLLDVFRVSGGKTHTYCFHGCADDGFEVNVKGKRPPTHGEDSPDGGYLRGFRWWERSDAKGGCIGGLPRREEETYWAAQCDGDDLVATWRVDRDAEKAMLRGAVMTEPRKHTRLTLFGQSESSILHGIARAAGGYGYYGRCLYAQKRSDEEMDSVFVALIEPYAAQPSIVACKQLEIAHNDADARKAVAVEVKTRNGRTDVLFADGRPRKTRQVAGGVKVAAEHACLSRDGQGLRQATLTGGKLLEAPSISIEVLTPRYEARITRVDYLDRRVTVEGIMPARLAALFFEVGNEQHKTTYQATSVETRGARSILTLRKGLEIMRTRVREANPRTGKVVGAIAMLRHRGRDAGLVASNDDLTRFWRVAYSGGNRHTGHKFTLTAMDPRAKGRPAFTPEDFPAGAGLRVWELGVGDSVAIQTGVSLRRIEPGLYEVYATSPFRLALAGKSIESTTDRKSWAAVTGDGGRAAITESALTSARGRLYLRTR